MYAGSTFAAMRSVDRWLGAHQKIDRVARRNLQALDPHIAFPSSRQILRFEGLDGPDGIKRKSPAKDEPWHFLDPFGGSDNNVTQAIVEHYGGLVTALGKSDTIRASFEAAWLAHAIVDGLTPAHHYPYEDELIKLRGGKGIETRNSPKEQVLMPGETLPKQVRNNWKMYGDKGLLSTHFAFEWGVAAIIMPLRLQASTPTPADIAAFEKYGVPGYFTRTVRQVAQLEMYDVFYKSGWTPRLAKQVRQELVPVIIRTVTLSWQAAAREAARQCHTTENR